MPNGGLENHEMNKTTRIKPMIMVATPPAIIKGSIFPRGIILIMFQSSCDDRPFANLQAFDSGASRRRTVNNSFARD